MDLPQMRNDDHRLIDAITIVKKQYMNDSSTDFNLFTILEKYPPNEIFFHCLQLPSQSLSFFIVIEPSGQKKSGFSFLCDVLAYLNLSRVNIVPLIPKLLEMFPPVVKTHIDVTDVLHMYDIIEELRTMGFFGKNLRYASEQIKTKLENWEGASPNYQIELTVSTDFYIMVKLLYKDLDFAFHIYEYLVSGEKIDINQTLSFLLLYLSILKFPVDPHRDFVPTQLVEAVLSSKGEIVLSDLIMGLLLQCRGKEYLAKLECWDRFCQIPMCVDQNRRFLVRAAPTTVLLLWTHLKDKEFYPELWQEIMKFFCMGDFRSDILETHTYIIEDNHS